jgi:hypothetical protein
LPSSQQQQQQQQQQQPAVLLPAVPPQLPSPHITAKLQVLSSVVLLSANS